MYKLLEREGESCEGQLGTYIGGCQDRIPQSVDGLGDQNIPSGFLPEFVSFLTFTALNQKTLNHNTLYTLVTNRSTRIKQS